MKPSDRYRRDAEALREFRVAFVDLVNNSKPRISGIGTVSAQPALDHEAWGAKRQRVALASGPAASAFTKFGSNLTLRNVVYVMNDINPVTNWEMALKDPEQMSPGTVVSIVEAAFANARRAHEDAVDRERGITGVIAAFLRWPSTLREAVDPENVGQARAAAVLGYVGQVLVGIFASLIATGLVTLGIKVFG